MGTCLSREESWRLRIQRCHQVEYSQYGELCVGHFFQKQDNVWIKWIHSLYIKGLEWQSYKPCADASWYWRKVCEVKEKLKLYVTREEISNMTHQSIKVVYDRIVGSQERVTWDKLVWNRLSTPKHIFIMWLAIQRKQQNSEKLQQIGVSNSNLCLICGNGAENHSHLFFNCMFNTKCQKQIRSCLGIHISNLDLQLICRWIRRSAKSMFQTRFFEPVLQLLFTMFGSVEMVVTGLNTIASSVNCIKNEIKIRVSTVIPTEGVQN